ncbi:hypothetical protein [Chryseobacterium polytrichastri]|uniref:Uncharacterized protein n=1 Tax=Chryseobacterium polytrichastri TaxID=1302687 RepID=A0A1M6TED8_9FLAO|nr:hypothetical protein [Chryseobacterium polytrichastri]SHK55392.1 hypothetical protein SAMN05444267_100571 [Chryseobacterium polytrichastri]
MKNSVLKSLLIFVVMSLLNAQFSEWILYFLKERSDGVAMVPIGVLVECLIVTVISFITILIFRKNYDSVLKMAVLFEIIYIITLMISGTNPLQYFFNKGDAEFLALFLYINSLIVLFILFLFDLLYSKIILSKSRN